jgi:hypothetical protein
MRFIRLLPVSMLGFPGARLIPDRPRQRKSGLRAALWMAASLSAFAQTTQISGVVTDPSGATVAKARILVEEKDRGLRRSAATNEAGVYAIPLLPPGNYRVTAGAAGFQTVARESVTLNVDQPARIDFALTIGEASDTVRVSSAAPLVNLDSGAAATTVDSTFVQDLPINGRSFQALLALAPGVVPTTNNQVGGFNVNGQRSTANAFTIDGVSANVASPSQASPTFSFGGGNVLATTPSGGTQSVASMEELQEFTVQTTGYGAQFGGQSGAQVALVTKSGTNRFHGSVYEFFRNEKLDANDWFLNRQGSPRQELRENNAGATMGGPVRKDRAFFFFSYELDPYRTPNTQRVIVPNAEYRDSAIPALKPLLDALPLPTTTNGALGGLTLGPNSGLFLNSIPEKGSTDATSLKWDDNWSHRLTTFARYHRTPSRITDSNVSTEADTFTNTQTLTGGATYIISPKAVNETRANYSRNSSGQQNAATGAFGATAPPDSALTRPGSGLTLGASSVTYQFADADGAYLMLGRQAKFVMHQFELGDTLTWALGSHRLSFGGDWRRLFPSFDANPYILSLGIRDATTGAAVATFGKGEAATLLMHSLGLFAADSWKVTPSLSVDWGLRWELVTPPTSTSGPKPFAAQNFDPENPAAATFAPDGAPLWKTRYRNFAPRLGAAYRLGGRHRFESVLRGAFGVNYDLGLGIIGAISSLSPFTRFGPAVVGTYPDILSQVNIPPVSTATVGRNSGVEFFDPNLQQPYTIAWNFGVQQSLGSNQSLAVDYIGSAGRRLLRIVTSQAGNAQGGIVLAQTNQGFSNYNALQAQLRRRLARGLQAMVNYTWSHSIDNSSSEVALGNGTILPGIVLPPASQRSDSSFDVRQAFSGAASYDLPAPFRQRALRRALENWSLDPLIRAYSAKPVNVQYIAVLSAGGSVESFSLHPNRVAGEALWLRDPSQPRGLRLNPAAFAVPPGGAPVEGNVGRNAIRGFPSSQVDVGLHRTFRIAERWRLKTGVEAFNLFNHPNFQDPNPLLASGLIGHYTPVVSFGTSQMMLGRVGNAGSGGSSSIYAYGTQRNVQLAVRFSF